MKVEDLSLSSLKFFLDSVENGSLTVAAELNHVSRPAISQALTRLEGWLGQRLLTHEMRRFALTPAGESFYRRARITFDQLNANLTADAAPDRSLRIGCSATLADAFLVPTLKKLVRPQSFRLSDVRIKTSTSQHLRELIQQDALHIAILVDDGRDTGSRGPLRSHCLREGKFLLASLNGQMNLPLITTEDRPEVLALRNFLQRRKQVFETSFRVESWGLASKIAREIEGSTLLPDFMVSAGLKPVRRLNFEFHYRILALHRKPEFLSQAENEFLKILLASKSNDAEIGPPNRRSDRSKTI